MDDIDYIDLLDPNIFIAFQNALKAENMTKEKDFLKVDKSHKGNTEYFKISKTAADTLRDYMKFPKSPSHANAKDFIENGWKSALLFSKEQEF